MRATAGIRRSPGVERAFGVARIVVRAVFPYRVLDAENAARTSGVILIANHRSMADAAGLYLTYPGPVAGPAKAELFGVPLFGRLLQTMGAFPLARDGMDHRAARTVADIYRRGGTVLIFPEGHRSHSAEMLPFSPNVARLIIKLQAVVVPAGIAGTLELLPPGEWLPRRSPVVIAYGEPFELKEFYSRPLTPGDLTRAASTMQEHVARALQRADAERARMLPPGRAR